MAAPQDADQTPETVGAVVKAVPDELKKDAVGAAVKAVPKKLKKDAVGAAMETVPDELKKVAVGAAMETVPDELKKDAVAAAMETVPDELKKDAVAAAMEAIISASESRLEGIVGRAVAESLRTPPLVKYEGWVRVDVVDEDGRAVEINKDDEIMLSPPAHFEIRVTIGPQTTGSLSVPQSTGSRLVALQISEGEESEFADFAIELDSDKRKWCHAPVQLRVGHKKPETVEFPLRVEDAASTPWLWMRVTQQDRTVQSLELHTRFVGAEK